MQKVLVVEGKGMVMPWRMCITICLEKGDAPVRPILLNACSIPGTRGSNETAGSRCSGHMTRQDDGLTWLVEHWHNAWKR